MNTRSRFGRAILAYCLCFTGSYLWGCEEAAESYSASTDAHFLPTDSSANRTDMASNTASPDQLITDTFLPQTDAMVACSEAPLPPDAQGCILWECTARDLPECWSCTETPVDDGDICSRTDGSVHQCVQGVCLEGTDPGEAGPHAFATTVATVNLGPWPANATIPLQLYVPTALTARPVVILHHGFLLSASDYVSYAEHLSSWGFVVVMPDILTSIFGGPTHTELKGIMMALIDWIESSEGNEDHPLWEKVDFASIAVGGHSLGGKVAMLTATEDSRIRAVMGIDPVDAQGGPFPRPEVDYPSVTPELMDLISVPVIVVGETTNASCEGAFCQACAPGDNNFQQYYLYAAGPAVEIEVLGANHMSFLDDTDCGTACSACPLGTDDPLITRRLTQGYLTAFLKVVLEGSESYRAFFFGNIAPLGLSETLVRRASKNGF